MLWSEDQTESQSVTRQSLEIKKIDSLGDSLEFVFIICKRFTETFQNETFAFL